MFPIKEITKYQRDPDDTDGIILWVTMFDGSVSKLTTHDPEHRAYYEGKGMMED